MYNIIISETDGFQRIKNSVKNITGLGKEIPKLSPISEFLENVSDLTWKIQLS